MNFKKITSYLLAIILCMQSINAEKMSRAFTVVLESNGYWEYRPVPDSSEVARTTIIDPKDNYSFTMVWELEGKSGNTHFKIKDLSNYWERNSVKISGSNADAIFDFWLKSANYATGGSLIAVWHSNNFIGVSLCINFVMSDDVTEEQCIEKFLNEESTQMIKYFKDYPIYSIPYGE
jgi:hypothetical protein